MKAKEEWVSERLTYVIAGTSAAPGPPTCDSTHSVPQGHNGADAFTAQTCVADLGVGERAELASLNGDLARGRSRQTSGRKQRQGQ